MKDPKFGYHWIWMIPIYEIMQIWYFIKKHFGIKE